MQNHLTWLRIFSSWLRQCATPPHFWLVAWIKRVTAGFVCLASQRCGSLDHFQLCTAVLSWLSWGSRCCLAALPAEELRRTQVCCGISPVVHELELKLQNLAGFTFVNVLGTQLPRLQSSLSWIVLFCCEAASSHLFPSGTASFFILADSTLPLVLLPLSPIFPHFINMLTLVP